jgi:hypothetical protein
LKALELIGGPFALELDYSSFSKLKGEIEAGSMQFNGNVLEYIELGHSFCHGSHSMKFQGLLHFLL